MDYQTFQDLMKIDTNENLSRIQIEWWSDIQ